MAQDYEVVVVGGGIAGSVAAKHLAEAGLSTLLIEANKTPRNKVCSGVQLPYMEKLIGCPIPEEILCSNQLNKAAISTPSGRRISGRLKLLNYWRSDFDAWLNSLAVKSGATFHDDVKLIDFKQNSEGVIIETSEGIINSQILIGADGLSPNSVTRKKLIPSNFSDKVTGTAVNLYFKGESKLRSDTLELFYRREFSDLMYSWLYHKDDLLVIGTSSKTDPTKSVEEFYKHVTNQYKLNGEIIRKEGYATSCLGGIYLGEDKILLTGDAAGLLDLYRGVGMDSAVLSGRIAAKAVIENKKTAITIYKKNMMGLIRQLERNNRKQELRYVDDNNLDYSLRWDKILYEQVRMIYFSTLNNLQPPEKMSLLPP